MTLTMPLCGPQFAPAPVPSQLWATDTTHWQGPDGSDPGKCHAIVPETEDHIGLCEKHLAKFRGFE